jgi:hypothetical protein
MKSVTGIFAGLATFFKVAVNETAVPCAGDGWRVSGVSRSCGAKFVGVRLHVPSAFVTLMTRSL